MTLTMLSEFVHFYPLYFIFTCFHRYLFIYLFIYLCVSRPKVPFSKLFKLRKLSFHFNFYRNLQYLYEFAKPMWQTELIKLWISELLASKIIGKRCFCAGTSLQKWTDMTLMPWQYNFHQHLIVKQMNGEFYH
jgi:hypothetical protein